MAPNMEDPSPKSPEFFAWAIGQLQKTMESGFAKMEASFNSLEERVHKLEMAQANQEGVEKAQSHEDGKVKIGGFDNDWVVRGLIVLATALVTIIMTLLGVKGSL